jgi:hypothetical protein
MRGSQRNSRTYRRKLELYRGTLLCLNLRDRIYTCRRGFSTLILVALFNWVLLVFFPKSAPPLPTYPLGHGFRRANSSAHIRNFDQQWRKAGTHSTL